MAHSRSQSLWMLDPAWGHAPWRASPARAERVLHLHLATPEEPQTSLSQALASLAAPGDCRRVDWPALPAAARHEACLRAAAELRPTMLFMQVQRPGAIAPTTVAAMRRAAGVPDLVVIAWCGDVGGSNGPFPAPGDQWAFDLSAHCDLMLYTSLSQVRARRSRGMLNAAYLQIGYDEDRFFPGADEAYGRQFDLVFLGTNYEERQWSSLPGNDAGLRRRLVAALRAEFGRRFGLFGHGWGAGIGHLAASRSGEAYRSSHLAVNLSICSYLERYSSDRLLRALASGTPVLMKTFDDWRSFGLDHTQNVLVWDTLEEALALARTWLRPERGAELRALGQRGAGLAREHHSWGVRMQELVPLIAAARGGPAEVSRPW